MLTTDRNITYISDPQAPAAPAELDAAAGEALVWEGRVGELFAVWIKGLVLTILTLGIYRFWMKTAIRRYIWSRVRLGGDTLEYTGTGMELFRGFLVALFAVILPLAGLQWAAAYAETAAGWDWDPEVAAFLFAFAIGTVLLPYARFAGLRYRLSRTRWRGIAFRQEGSAWAYARVYLAWWALNLLCLGLLTPQVTMWIESFRLRRLKFGSVSARLSVGRVPCFWFYVAWLVLALGLLWIGGEIHDAVANDRFRIDESTGKRIYHLQNPLPLLGFLGAFVVARCIHYGQEASIYRYLARHFALGELRLHCDVTGPSLFSLHALNWLLVVLTLGLGRPIAWHMTLDYIATHVRLGPTEALAEAAARDDSQMRRGEGLLDALDAGIA